VPPSSELDEFALIAKYFAPLARSSPGSLGLLDDAALLETEPGQALVLAADMAVEGIHFTESDPPELIGRKVLRYNLSDLAAMGAAPIAYLLTLAKPEQRSSEWVGAIAAGLAEDQENFGISLIGGDTSASPGPAMLSITVIGSVGSGEALQRSGAKPGDVVFVSGTVGDGALGLKSLKGDLGGLAAGDRDYLEDRYRLPQPRLALGRALVGLATAAIDVSDGLVADLAHICQTSGVGAVIEAPAVPFSPAAKAAISDGRIGLSTLLTGGDDYELLFCVPEERLEAVARLEAAGGVAVTRIGRISEGSGVEVLGEDGKPLAIESQGYRHF
jgi:thiamine-monophosphate kinase